MWSSNLVRQCRRDRFSRDDQGCRRRCNVSRGVRIGDIRNTHFQDQTNKHMRRPFVHFTCVSVIFIIGLNVAGPCQSFKTLKEGHSS